MPTRATQAQSKVTDSEVKTEGLDILANVALSTETNVMVTRSGRVSKAPVRYEPVEQVEDDYADDDYDSDESDISSTVSSDAEDEDEDEDSDADDDGNLDGFVVPDKSESGESDSDGEPPVSVQKRRAVAVKKRPAAAGRK